VFGFMEREKATHTIRTMARVLGVSVAGFYAHRRRPRSLHALGDEVLATRIVAIHAASRRTYGAPRIQAELRLAQDIRCGRTRIGRLMREAGLRGVIRGRFVRTTVPDPTAPPAPDLVNRDFHPDAPNQLWVADITHIATAEGSLYLAVALDACTRRVVGWAMRTTVESEIVTAALDMAIRRTGQASRGLVHHSDRGGQYTSFAFGRRCREAGIARSMGSRGDCYDNAMAESFFATLECELLDRTRFATRAAAESAIFEFIEAWYNRRRRHSALDYLSPMDYERRRLETATAPTC
jgi:putative transposase